MSRQMREVFVTFNSLVLTNTLWPHKPSRRSTWDRLDGKHNNQVNYILLRKRFQSEVSSHKTRNFPEADIGRDHDLVRMTSRVRLKKARKPIHPRLRFDLKKLSDLSSRESCDCSSSTETREVCRS